MARVRGTSATAMSWATLINNQVTVDLRTSVDIAAAPETVWAVTSGGALATLRLHYEGVIDILLARLTRAITDWYLAYETAGLKQRSESLVRQ